jgi:hypothetical protein
MANITDIVNSIIRYLGKVSITCNGRWKDNVDYDRLCVVYDDFASYISKQKVPAGTKLTNTTYWQVLSNLQDEIKIDYETFKTEVLNSIADLNKRQITGRIVVDTIEDLNALTIENVNAGAEVYVLDNKKTYIIDSIDTQSNKEYHEQVYNSLSTMAYSSVPKEDRKVENIKILRDYIVEFGDKITTFPITLIQAVLDLESGKDLSSLMSMFNYLVLPWNGNFAATVNEVPLVMRNLGTLVTYKDTDGFIWTKRYKLSDFSNANWSNIDNWDGWDLQAAESEIIEAVEKIFTNIDDYPPVKNVITTGVTTAVNEVLNNITTYPDLYNQFKSVIETKVGNVFTNLDNYPNLKSLLNTYVVNQVNYIFNNIDSYPTLKTAIENFVKAIFTNIDSYPSVKKVITDKITEIAPSIINTIFNNIDNYPTLKSAINLSVYNRTDYVFKHLDEYPELKALIEASGGSSFLTVTLLMTSEDDSQLENIDEVRTALNDMPSLTYKPCILDVKLGDVVVFSGIGSAFRHEEDDYNFSCICPILNQDHRTTVRGSLANNSFKIYFSERSLGTIYINAEYRSDGENGKTNFYINNNAQYQVLDFINAKPTDSGIYIFDCIITYKTNDPVWATVRGTLQILPNENTKIGFIFTSFNSGGSKELCTSQNWSWPNIDSQDLILDSVETFTALDFIHKIEKGKANGVCPLNASSKVDSKYLPSYVDDVMDFTTSINFANTSEIINHPAYNNQVIITGSTTVDPYKNKIIKLNANTKVGDWVIEDLVADKIYCNTTDNTIWRWSGTTLVKIESGGVVIGEIEGTAYDGAKGKKVTDNVNTIPEYLFSAQDIDVNRSDVDYSVALDRWARQANGNWGLDDHIDIVRVPLANEQFAGLISPTEKTKLNGIVILKQLAFFGGKPLTEYNLTDDVTFDQLKNANCIILKYGIAHRYSIVESIVAEVTGDTSTIYISYKYISNTDYELYRNQVAIVFKSSGDATFKILYTENVYKGGFDIGEAFGFIVQKIQESNTGDSWEITNEEDFRTAMEGESIISDLVNIPTPLTFLQYCCNTCKPLICTFSSLHNSTRFYQKALRVKTGYTYLASSNVNNCYFSVNSGVNNTSFILKVDPDGLFTFKRAD